MFSPLDSFQDRMINFDIYRNQNFIFSTKGLKNIENNTNKRYIGLYPFVEIQIGDVLINSNIKYYIVDIDTQTWQGQVCQLKAYYQTTPPNNQQSNSITYNINNASNSIIGNQQSAIINNSNFSIEDLKQLVELYGNNDKQQLNELVSSLTESLKKDDFHKGKLSKFGDLIAKHAWLPTAIAQIIAGYLSH